MSWPTAISAASIGGVLEAGVAVTIVPCVVIHLLPQKYYVGGLLSGVVK